MQSHHIVIPQFIPIWNRITNVDDHNQIIDFTENPLYKSNPTGINNYVNDLNSIVPYNVRMIINGLASTDREIYNLVNNSRLMDFIPPEMINSLKMGTTNHVIPNSSIGNPLPSNLAPSISSLPTSNLLSPQPKITTRKLD